MQSKFDASSVSGWEVAREQREYRGVKLRPLQTMILHDFADGFGFFYAKIDFVMDLFCKEVMMKTNTTKKLAITAMFVAVGVVLNIFSSQLPKLGAFGRMSLIYSYCTIAGVLIGPWLGAASAAIADIIPALILPEGGIVWMPLITLSNAVMAIIPGICVERLPLNNLFLKLLISSVISFVICTLGLTAAGETLLYCYFGAAPFYPTITGLIEGGMSVYWAFVVFKAGGQPFWILCNLLLSTGILSSPALLRYVQKQKIS